MFTTQKSSQVQMRCTGTTGTGCKNNVPFRVYKKSVESSVGLRIAVDVEKVLSSLGTILPANAQVTRTAADLNIYSLCEECWAKVDAQWAQAPGGQVGVYLAAAARAVPAGLYFNTVRPDFQNENGGPNMRKVKCTVVHEMVHWTVAATTKGFQNIGGTILGMRGPDWDECMTDHLALSTYRSLNWGKYDTMYNDLPMFIDKAIEIQAAAPRGWKQNQLKSKLKEAFPSFDDSADADFAAEVKKLRQPLFEKLARRYVKGNDLTTVESEGPTFKAFVEKVFPSSFGSRLNTGSGGLYGPKTYD